MNLYALHAPSDDLVRVAGGDLPDAASTPTADIPVDIFQVRLRVRGATQLRSVLLRSEPDNEEHLVELQPVASSGAWRYYVAPLQTVASTPVTRYSFKLVTPTDQWWLSAVGMSRFFPERDHHFRLIAGYRPARWVWDQVFYQIFPERFRDGEPSNNVQSGEYLYQGKAVVARSWDDLPDRRQGPREFFGGDLQGILQSLPYLDDLGVSALYLNPVFTSPSSHKYDTVDYTNVDPHFGGNEVLAELCNRLHAAGKRIVLDAVINHTSERHPWFDRYREAATPGAFGNRDAATRSHYTFLDHGDDESYVGWAGAKTLPVLNFADPEVRRKIYQDSDAVLRRWLRPPYAIDGWRFDVIHMLGEGPGAKNNHAYVRAFRQAVREENPEAYLLGEHFFEATPWLQGDQEDGAMNYYGFTLPLWAFLAGTDHRGHPSRVDAEDLDAMLTRARARLPHEIALSQFNLLDSHDTPRLKTLLGGDRELFEVAVTALFGYIGVPCIYYGDEIGLEGGGDPDCRRPFPWDQQRWDQRLREHYRSLIALRHATPALRYGSYLTLYARGDVFAFARFFRGQLVVVALNRGSATTVSLPIFRAGGRGSFRALASEERYTCRGGRLRLALPSKGSVVAVADEPAAGVK